MKIRNLVMFPWLRGHFQGKIVTKSPWRGVYFQSHDMYMTSTFNAFAMILTSLLSISSSGYNCCRNCAYITAWTWHLFQVWSLLLEVVRSVSEACCQCLLLCSVSRTFFWSQQPVAIGFTFCHLCYSESNGISNSF